MSGSAQASRDIDTFSQFLGQDFSWNIANLVKNFGPVLGVVILYLTLAALGFYSTCISCSVNKIVLLTTYAYSMSIYFLQKEVDACGHQTSITTLSIFTILPLLIFVFTLTAPLWASFGLLFEKHLFSPSLPLNVLVGLMSMFTAVVVYRVAISYSLFLLNKRICKSDASAGKSFWTFWQ